VKSIREARTFTNIQVPGRARSESHDGWEKTLQERVEDPKSVKLSVKKKPGWI
jgi:hypothetical protein